MKLLLITLWLAVPLAVAAYHYGPGQEMVKADVAAAHLDEAATAESAGDPAKAIEAMDRALAALPADAMAQAREIRLARAKQRMPIGQLPEAHDELEALFAELSADPAADADLKHDTQAALAGAKYYLAWLMRLEGGAEEEWRPEIEASRQHFRHLAEAAQSTGQTTLITTHRQSLESAIRLGRMDLTELQGLPLPKQCKNCKSGKCKKPGAPKKQPPQDSRGAGKTQGPDQSGS
jgi:hypothetical protein